MTACALVKCTTLRDTTATEEDVKSNRWDEPYVMLCPGGKFYIRSRQEALSMLGQ